MMRIKELKLYTRHPGTQRWFYSNVLELEVLRRTGREVSFAIGESILTLVTSESAHPYHFAINIPSSKEEKALEWLKERVEILDDEGREIQPFDSWNARAMYFYDADKNIVEFISRRNLKYPAGRTFDPGRMFEISEIGVPVNNIEKVFNALSNELGIGIFDGDFRQFCAIGGETGLFICINKRKKTWFPVGDKAYTVDFTAIVEVGGDEFLVSFEKGNIRVEQAEIAVH
ncbi:MAG: VOC family protein [Flavobacteriales bacterium]|nr:VOC family protein [Flavobacteriales bacterium]